MHKQRQALRQCQVGDLVITPLTCSRLRIGNTASRSRGCLISLSSSIKFRRPAASCASLMVRRAIPDQRVTASVNNMVAAVDVKCLAGNELSRIMRQERSGSSDIVDADEAAGGRLCLRFIEQRIEFRNP